jgi:hypothetical protein
MRRLRVRREGRKQARVADTQPFSRFVGAHPYERMQAIGMDLTGLKQEHVRATLGISPTLYPRVLTFVDF